MGKADRISGFFWLIFSLFVSYESYKLGLGTLYKPGPGFLFFWIGIVIGILSVAVVVRSFRNRKPDHGREIAFKKSNLTKVLLVLISLFLYSFFMERLGFLIVTLLLFIFLLRVVEKKKWSFTVLISLIVTVAAYLVFEKGLRSQLPAGLLEFLRF
jgi:hypothetical protein